MNGRFLVILVLFKLLLSFVVNYIYIKYQSLWNVNSQCRSTGCWILYQILCNLFRISVLSKVSFKYCQFVDYHLSRITFSVVTNSFHLHLMNMIIFTVQPRPWAQEEWYECCHSRLNFQLYLITFNLFFYCGELIIVG